MQPTKKPNMKQEMTNEEVANIFAMYRDAPAMWGIHPVEILGFDYEHNTALVIGTETKSLRYWQKLSDCKLLLKPLSAISDEDAIEVVRIILDKSIEWKPVEINRYDWRTEIVTNIEPDITDADTTVKMYVAIHNVISSRIIRWIWEYIKGNGTGICEMGCPNIIDAVDFLRSKGYALPYKGQSLFELGIAIDASQLNKA